MTPGRYRLILIAIIVVGFTLVAILWIVGQNPSLSSTPTNNISRVVVEEDTTNNSLIQNDISNAVDNLFQLTAMATVNTEIDVQVEVQLSVPTITPELISLAGYWRYGLVKYLKLGSDGSAEFPSFSQINYGTYRYDGTYLTIHYIDSREEEATLQFIVQRLNTDTLVVENINSGVVTSYSRIY